jgi:hypothetical protein
VLKPKESGESSTLLKVEINMLESWIEVALITQLQLCFFKLRTDHQAAHETHKLKEANASISEVGNETVCKK